ncbi:ACT domain-containing protein [Clostridium tarantellae]|uniref:UPF0735 ACT domain-containing protein GBZ86_12520 n=1 Tax=Clostridium tarantellae TaxID=39493 RepID=A0A6I1MQX3_9CLOT|nr:ACT domain-containing protein [Clostridium tarantellae]MPQ44567.1 ACT domain-containing protein [Clostridium tarantellae]
MEGKLLVIDKRVLPEVFEKVINAKRLLKEGKVKEITEATRLSGISRSVYYKYKDYVFEFSETSEGRKIIFNLVLTHKKGVLSAVLNLISDKGGNILTIDQSIPINEAAYVSITMDMSTMICDINKLLKDIEEIPGITKVEFIAME